MFKRYLQNLYKILDLPPKSIDLTLELLEISNINEDDKMHFILLLRTKSQICKKLGWSNISSFDNALQKLLSKNIIIRLERGIYQFNADLFGIRDINDISKADLTISHNEKEDIHIFTSFSYDKTEEKPKRTRKRKSVKQEPEQEQLEGQLSLIDLY